ncbi:putative sensor histidine kinase [Streptococcus sp. DD13]|nr:putative sensor histidine kinase [Streptococcus sp. DD13]
MIFLSFPILGVFYFGYPFWTIWLTAGFTLSYLTIIHSRVSSWTNLIWLYMLAYVFYMTIAVNGGMMWFFFYFTSPLAFKFKDNLVSFRMLSYVFTMLALIIFAIVYGVDITSQIMTVLVPVINLTMLFYWKKEAEKSEQERVLWEKNQQINLLSAENERNRIGRDLHDTLGHTFAMMTIKTELALRQLEKGDLTAVRKNLEELHATSRSSMQEVRDIVTDLTYRSLSEELTSLDELLTTAGIEVHLTNELEGKLLSPVVQSTLVMLVRELANNVIKHSQAGQVRLRLFEDQAITVVMEDDGIGFGELTGRELHSIRDRLGLLTGTVTVESRKNPTRVVLTIEGDKR